MGQKQSSANITKANFNPEVEVVSRATDAHYGDVKIVRDTKTNETMVLKEIVLDSKQAFENEIAYLNTRINVRHPNVVNVIGYNTQDKHNFCSTYYKISLFIENLTQNLQTELENRRAQRDAFTEPELLLIADDLITGLAYFQGKDVSHGDIRPANIFHQNQIYKLSDPSLNVQKGSNGLYLAIVQGAKTYLSPELIPQVPQSKIESSANPYKSDMYSSGVTLLSLATLTNAEELYDYQKGTINQGLVRERLNNVKQNYSEFTHDLIEDMLTPTEDARPDFTALAAKISPHKAYMRKGYQGPAISTIGSRVIEERGEKVKRAALPGQDDEEEAATTYRVGSIEDLEARIRAAIVRTEETFRLVKATPGLSGVFRTVTAKHDTNGTTAIISESPERLVKSQIAIDHASTYQAPATTNTYTTSYEVPALSTGYQAPVTTTTTSNYQAPATNTSNYQAPTSNSTYVAPGGTTYEVPALSTGYQGPSTTTNTYEYTTTYNRTPEEKVIKSYNLPPADDDDVRRSDRASNAARNSQKNSQYNSQYVPATTTYEVPASSGYEVPASSGYEVPANAGYTTTTTYTTTTYTTNVAQPETYYQTSTSQYQPAAAETQPQKSSHYYGITTVEESEQKAAVDNLVARMVDAVSGTGKNSPSKGGSFSDHLNQIAEAQTF